MKLEFRPATIADARQLFDWRNDEATRAQSFEIEPLVFENHLAWFERSLTNPDRAIFIVEHDGTGVGMIRKDRLDQAWVLSWMVNPVARGKGYGKELLKQFVEEKPEAYIAEIKHGNTASINMAEYAGFYNLESFTDFQRWVYPSQI